jgi:hypothetical protein
MPDRKTLVTALWLASSMALLAPVLVAPIRTPGFVTASVRPHCLRRNFVISPGQPKIHLSARTDADAVPEVDALPSEDEEQDRADPLDQPRVTFLLPRSFRKVPDRLLIAPPSILSLFPLRC